MNLKEFGDDLVNHRISHYKKYPKIKKDFECFMWKDNTTTLTKMGGYGNPLDHIQSVIDKYSPDLYLIIMEGWMLMINRPISYNYGDCNKSKDRIEVLMIVGKTINGKEQYARTFKMFRKYKDIIFEEMKNSDGSPLDMRSPKLR